MSYYKGLGIYVVTQNLTFVQCVRSVCVRAPCGCLCILSVIFPQCSLLCQNENKCNIILFGDSQLTRYLWHPIVYQQWLELGEIERHHTGLCCDRDDSITSFAKNQVQTRYEDYRVNSPSRICSPVAIPVTHFRLVRLWSSGAPSVKYN